MTVFDLIKSMDRVHMTNFIMDSFTNNGKCEKCAFRPHEDGRHDLTECYNGHCSKVILEWLRKDMRE